jgi:hypothetical protein
MRGKTARVKPTQWRTLEAVRRECAGCGGELKWNYTKHRTVATLAGVLGLEVRIYVCGNRACNSYHHPYHPEEEGRLVLPCYGYGLDVLALIGTLRYREHASVLQIHGQLLARGLQIGQRNVSYLIECYDELVTLSVDRSARRERLRCQGRAILAIDGLQPDAGHEVLWLIREVLSREVLLARPLLSSARPELADLLRTASSDLGVPVVGAVSDGQESIRLAVAEALPGVPHQLCHFHYLRQAALPIYEADRHAKKELKKWVRGVRRVERAVEAQENEMAQITQGYCAAVRAALTDDGQAPLDPGGLKLQERLRTISQSLEDVATQKGGLPKPLESIKKMLHRALDKTASLWPDIRRAYDWLWEAAHILKNTAAEGAASVKARYTALRDRVRDQAEQAGSLQEAVAHFLAVTQSFWPGLFHCYAVPGLPATNNDLEQFFGSIRHHERRVSGHKKASASLVLRGSVHVFAYVLTVLAPFTAGQLAPADLEAWRAQRRTLRARSQTRLLQRRFRRNPGKYLTELEGRLLRLDLPP